MGDGTEGGVMVKAAPGAPLAVVETNLLLEVLIVALDAPAQLDRANQLSMRSIGRQRRQVVLRRRCFAVGPLADQPLLLTRSQVSPFWVSIH